MAQQTAVEWLVRKLSMELIGEIPLHMCDEIREAVQQAKQMEKEQIISAHKEGNKYNGWALRHEHEKYYNETFGNK